jgi:hypothetical protein
MVGQVIQANGLTLFHPNKLYSDKGKYEYQQDLRKPLASYPNLRTVVDGLPCPELFIYSFLETDFLLFSQELSASIRKHMLKSALIGLAALS